MFPFFYYLNLSELMFGSFQLECKNKIYVYMSFLPVKEKVFHLSFFVIMFI